MKQITAYNLFDRFPLDTLESLEEILRSCGRSNATYKVVKDVFKIKEKGIATSDEYDNIIGILDSNLSQIKFNTNLSEEEIDILEHTLSLVINTISSRLGKTEYKGTKEFLTKLNISELSLMHVLAEALNKKNSKVPFSQINDGVLSLINGISIYTLEELNFLSSLLTKSSNNLDTDNCDIEPVLVSLVDLLNVIDEETVTRNSNLKIKKLNR